MRPAELKFELLMTTDGQSWTHIPPSQLPPALEGEGAFAASNSCLAILRNPVTSSTPVTPSAAKDPGVPDTKTIADTSAPPPVQPWKSGASAPREPAEKEKALAPEGNIWFATGGRAARVFHSSDRGQTWQVFNTPIAHGPDSAGIFSIAFRDANHGVIAGGDYKHPEQDGPNLAFTNDAGKTWTLSKVTPQSYYSAVAFDRKHKSANAQNLDENQANLRLFIVGPKFAYDFRPPANPVRISPRKKFVEQFNAASPYPEGGILVVGSKGTIASIP